METREQYDGWYDSLSEEERDKYDFLEMLSRWESDTRFHELMDQYNIRREFALYRHKNYKSFAEEELIRASDELTMISISCDWRKIHKEIAGVRDRLQWRKSQEPIIVTEDQVYGENDELLILDNQEDYHRLKIGDEYVSRPGIPYIYVFKYLMYNSHTLNDDTGGLSREYLKPDFGDAWYQGYDYSHLKDFDKIIDFLGRLKWLIELINIVVGETYDKPAEIDRRNLTLESAIKDTDAYQQLIAGLIAKGLIDPDTYTWKDAAGGWRGILAAKIKEWQHLTGHLLPRDIKAIAQNTFHRNISISLIEKTKPFGK